MVRNAEGWRTKLCWWSAGMPRRRSPVRTGPFALMLIVQLSLYPRLRLGPTAQHPAATILLVPPLPLAAYLLRRWPVTTDTRRPS